MVPDPTLRAVFIYTSGIFSILFSFAVLSCQMYGKAREQTSSRRCVLLDLRFKRDVFPARGCAPAPAFPMDRPTIFWVEKGWIFFSLDWLREMKACPNFFFFFLRFNFPHNLLNEEKYKRLQDTRSPHNLHFLLPLLFLKPTRRGYHSVLFCQSEV